MAPRKPNENLSLLVSDSLVARAERQVNVHSAQTAVSSNLKKPASSPVDGAGVRVACA